MRAAIKENDEGEELISFNPATGEEVGRVPQMSASDIDVAVHRSRSAFAGWKQNTFRERRAYIMKTREVILSQVDEIAHLISAESGKPFGEAIAMEIAPVLDLMQYFARNTEKMLRPAKINIGLYGMLGRTSKIIYHPLGVVGIIPA